MGLFSKLLGNKEQPLVQPNDNAKQIAELIGCECKNISGFLNSDSIMKLYKDESEKGQREGYIPVILVLNGHLLEMIQCNYKDNGGAEIYRSKMLSADISHGESFLKQRFDENMEMFDEDFGDDDIFGEYTDGVTPALNFLSTDNNEKLILARIPANKPWEVFAWIPFGGWNECPDTEDMMAVCNYWHEKYKAVPAVISSDELQMFLSAPIKSIDEALKAAEEHYAFCNDTVDQGAGTLKALASTLKDSNVWYFWWD